MIRLCAIAAGILFAAGNASVASTAAAVRPIEFVHALQENGYGDVAVDYLTMVAQEPRLPRELREVWDLEMAKSLQEAAGDAFDAKEAAALKAAAWKHLEKFIREKPKHPEAVVAIAAWADLLLRRALELVREANSLGASDTAEREQLAAAARTALEEARQKYKEAHANFRARLGQLPLRSKLPTKKAERSETADARELIETHLRGVELQLALVDCYVAQTYAETDDAARLAALKKAVEALDAIFQENRGTVVGLYAHLWHGKAMVELGNAAAALDILDEVLATAPEPYDRGAPTGLEPIFAEAERWRLAAIAKKQPDESLAEAMTWLREFRRFRQTDGYQGVARDAVRAVLAKAGKLSGPERTKILGEALQVATDGSKVHSPFQQELALARQELLRLSGRGLEANSFEEAVALGDAASAEGQWQTAVLAYEKAVELAEKSRSTNSNAVAAVREALAGAKINIAKELFDKRQYDPCEALVNEIVRDEEGNVRRQSSTAARASAVGVAVALQRYADASTAEKPAALAKLLAAAELTESHWPERPEADDARMARAQAKLVVGQVRDAIAILERVNPKSDRYAAAMTMAGQCYWNLYLTARRANAPDAGGPTPEMIADRDKALACLERAVERFALQSGVEKRESRVADAQVLLAEMRFHNGQVREAASLYEKLIDSKDAAKAGPMDARAVRTYAGALRAFCSIGAIDRASELASALLENGADAPAVNDAIVQFAVLLRSSATKGGADVKKATPTFDVLRRMLVGLSQRKQLDFGEMMFVAESLAELGMSSEASGMLQGILKRADVDTEFSKSARKGMTRLHVTLLQSLRHEGKFAQALRQTEKLIEENPAALEPLMEKGRILEEWAEKEPVRFGEAANHWTSVRVRLQGMKKRPPEYYDVTYRAAACLVRQAETEKDRAACADRAKQAEQVLKATLVLSPELNGPDMVAKYKSLLSKAIGLQGRPSAARKDVSKP